MRCALLLICAGIASVTFVADVSIALTFSLICIVLLLFALLLTELLLAELSKAANILRRLVIGLLLVSMGVVWHLNGPAILLVSACQKYSKGKRFRLRAS
jgi:hypothetical protein